MAADSPAEYVANLEKEVKALRARLSTTERDIEYWKDAASKFSSQVSESDEIRSAMVEAATSAAQVTATTLGRLQRSEKVVECAYAVMRACARSDKDDGGRACDALIQAVLKHQEGQPS